MLLSFVHLCWEQYECFLQKIIFLQLTHNLLSYQCQPAPMRKAVWLWLQNSLCRNDGNYILTFLVSALCLTEFTLFLQAIHMTNLHINLYHLGSQGIGRYYGILSKFKLFFIPTNRLLFIIWPKNWSKQVMMYYFILKYSFQLQGPAVLCPTASHINSVDYTNYWIVFWSYFESAQDFDYKTMNIFNWSMKYHVDRRKFAVLCLHV